MSGIDDACQMAVRNLKDYIRAGSMFPRNVFSSGWGEFQFFDSDWMFDAGFVEQVRVLLDTEGASCACIEDLDAAVNGEQTQDRFYITRDTQREEYQALLRGENPGTGWSGVFSRFACTSSGGEWCMYAERRDEIAVVAFRRGVPVQRYSSVLVAFKAAQISEAIEKRLTHAFSTCGISPEWREELSKEYRTET